VTAKGAAVSTELPADLQTDLETIDDALGTLQSERASGILTSQDAAVQALDQSLTKTDLADGFERRLLPVKFDVGTASIVRGAPGSVAAEHSHTSDTLHSILSGSARVAGKDLSAGDWVYIPAGAEYSFEVLGDEACISEYRHWLPPGG
jgi:quercetin dioxygenase-like cupin family protein